MLPAMPDTKPYLPEQKQIARVGRVPRINFLVHLTRQSGYVPLS
jgi:hypothetical protein